MIVLEIKGIDVESIDDLRCIFDPHGGAIEVNEEPLVRVEVVAVSQLDSIQDGAVLGQNESAARIGCIDMEPNTLKIKCGAVRIFAMICQ